MKRKIKFGDKILVSFSSAERDLVLAHTPADGARKEQLRGARVHDDKVDANVTLDELDELLVHIQTGANEADDDDVQARLDALHARLTKLEASYEEEDDGEDY